MPWLSAHPCRRQGCGNLVRGGAFCSIECSSKVRKVSDQARPSPAARGYDGDWRRRRAAYLQEHPNCRMCGDDATVVDHVIPLSQGGEDRESNWQALCAPCHNGPKQRRDRVRRAQLPAVIHRRG